MVRLVITRYHQMTTIVYLRQNFMCVIVCVCVCEYVCMYICFICVQYFKDLWYNIINWHFKQTMINDLWLHNHQQNKTKTNKPTKIIFTVVDSGTCSVLLRSQIKNDCTEIPETVALVINWWPYHLSHYIYLVSLSSTSRC